MKNLWNRTKNSRDASLSVMQAALLVAVALVSGVVVCAIAYNLVMTWGIVILYIAIEISIGISIGSLAYSVVAKLFDMAGKRPSLRRMASNVVAFGGDEDASFTE